MKKLFFVLVVLLISACSKSEDINLAKYINDASSYDVDSEVERDILNMNIPLVNIKEESVQHETLILLSAIKSYPTQEVDEFKAINIHFLEKSTNKSVADIKVTVKTLKNTKWDEIGSFTDIPNKVDYYNYKF